jgi:hypothetical protein
VVVVDGMEVHHTLVVQADGAPSDGRVVFVRGNDDVAGVDDLAHSPMDVLPQTVVVGVDVDRNRAKVLDASY